MISTTYEWDDQCKSININHLITLCEIGEDYKSFCEDLERLIKSKTNKDLINEAYKVMQGKFSIRSGKYKSFIEKHKRTIEVMKNYFCLSNLTFISYDVKGNRRRNLPEDYFYEYLQKNKENIEIIKEVALKLKKLGFREIKYGENLDFKEFEYYLNTSSERYFAFLENMEVKSTYLNNPIKYKTNGSCYCMCLYSECYDAKKEVSKYYREIYLNSLILDPNSLPNEITTESTIGVIKKLAANKKAEYSDIRNSVDLSIATSDLKSQFEHLKQVVANIDKIKNNEELASVLYQMQGIIIQLQNFDKAFEREIINSNTSITEQTMEQEKKLYLKRRYSFD
ncbi:MAG: hypothetical protein ACI31M_01115 [Bacilli bacterium]